MKGRLNGTLSGQRLRILLDYALDTGVFRWRKRVNNRCRPNGVAGSVYGPGYIKISIDGRSYQAHRLAWLYVKGEWPPSDIDHRDLNPSNNAIANLRPASNTENGANTKGRRGRTLPKGVTFKPALGKYMARIKVNYRHIYLGYYLTAEEANAAYATAAKVHFGEFARAA